MRVVPSVSLSVCVISDTRKRVFLTSQIARVWGMARGGGDKGAEGDVEGWGEGRGVREAHMTYQTCFLLRDLDGDFRQTKLTLAV